MSRIHGLPDCSIFIQLLIKNNFEKQQNPPVDPNQSVSELYKKKSIYNDNIVLPADLEPVDIRFPDGYNSKQLFETESIYFMEGL